MVGKYNLKTSFAALDIGIPYKMTFVYGKIENDDSGRVHILSQILLQGRALNN